MIEFGTSSAFKKWVRVRVLGYGFGVRGREVKSRDCAARWRVIYSKSPSPSFDSSPKLIQLIYYFPLVRFSPREALRSKMLRATGMRAWPGKPKT